MDALDGEMSAWSIAQPLVASAGALLVAALTTVYVAPVACRAVLASRAGRSPRALLLLLLLPAALFAVACAAVGSSDLLGAFCGGLFWSDAPAVKAAWAAQAKRLVQWGSG